MGQSKPYLQKSYLNFISLCEQDDILSAYFELTLEERNVLSRLGQYWLINTNPTVKECMNMTEEYSQSSLFRYLKGLRNKGYVEFEVDHLDNRVKYLTPSDQAINYFNKMSDILMLASKK